jgi:hypothetical protein
MMDMGSLMFLKIFDIPKLTDGYLLNSLIITVIVIWFCFIVVDMVVDALLAEYQGSFIVIRNNKTV